MICHPHQDEPRICAYALPARRALTSGFASQGQQDEEEPGGGQSGGGSGG